LKRYQVLLEKKASNSLDKLNKDTNHRITVVLHILQDEGFSSRLDIKKLRGYKSHYRLRIGKYRILFELTPEKTIVVYAILPRKTAY
jgi:mRNA interferase RelE/StbE